MQNSFRFSTFRKPHQNNKETKKAIHLWFEVCLCLIIPFIQKHRGPLLAMKWCLENLCLVGLCLPGKLRPAWEVLSFCLVFGCACQRNWEQLCLQQGERDRKRTLYMGTAALNTCMCFFARFLCPQLCASVSLRSHVFVFVWKTI